MSREPRQSGRPAAFLASSWIPLGSMVSAEAIELVAPSIFGYRAASPLAQRRGRYQATPGPVPGADLEQTLRRHR